MAVGEGRLAIDQHDVDALLQPQELQPVVEQQRVGPVLADGMEPALHPVLVDEHQHVLEVGREHERLVARHIGIEQERAAVRNHARRMAILDGAELVHELLGEGHGLALISAAQDRHLPPPFRQLAREEFHHRRLARAAHGQVAHADDEASECVHRPEPRFVPPEPEPHA
jgi:hypothetical protein